MQEMAFLLLRSTRSCRHETVSAGVQLGVIVSTWKNATLIIHKL